MFICETSIIIIIILIIIIIVFGRARAAKN